MVLATGIEPAQVALLDPKSNASANFATRAIYKQLKVAYKL